MSEGNITSRLGRVFFLSFYLGWHTLPSHASLSGRPVRPASQAGLMRNPKERTSVVLRDTIRLT